MPYYRHGIDAKPTQLRNLRKGNQIRLTHAQLKGPVIVHLTKAQMTRLSKANAAGKGATLKLSQTQLRYNRQSGSGIFDVLKKGAKALAGVAIKELTPVVSNAAQNAVGNLIQAGSDKLANKIVGEQKGEGFVDDLVGFVAPIAQAVLTKRFGGGVRKRRRGTRISRARGLYPPGTGRM